MCSESQQYRHSRAGGNPDMPMVRSQADPKTQALSEASVAHSSSQTLAWLDTRLRGYDEVGPVRIFAEVSDGRRRQSRNCGACIEPARSMRIVLPSFRNTLAASPQLWTSGPRAMRARIPHFSES